MRIVLAYSGGLDTAAAIARLRELHRADIIAVTFDLGDDRALEAVRDRALAAGAVRAHVVDVRDSFAKQFVLPSLQADAVSDAGHPTPKALGRPLMGHALVDMARIERAVAVAHGCDTDGLDRVRLESAVRALNPGLRLLSPGLERETFHDEALEALEPRGPLPAPHSRTGDRPYDVDTNLWGRTLTPRGSAGQIPDTAFTLTKPLGGCPDEPASVELSFEAGVPTAINGVAMPLIDLVQSLGTIAGAHGVGRVRGEAECIEAPAAIVLHAAHRALEKRVWDAGTRTFARTVGRRYAEIVEQGGWFLPLRPALDAFVAQSQSPVTGRVGLKLFKTKCEAVHVTLTTDAQ